MTILWLVVLLSQANTERNPFATIQSRVFREIEAATPVLEKLVRDGKQEGLVAELVRLDRIHDQKKDADAKMVFMAHILSAIATEDGGARSFWIRESCEPFALAVATKPLKIPAHAELLESQVMAFHEILAETRYSNEPDKREEHLLRRISRVKLATEIWTRVVESQIASSRQFSEELVENILNGEDDLRMPPLPKTIPPFSITPGQSPDSIRDPKIRQDYMGYLKQCQDVRFRFSQAASLHELRRGSYLRITRQYLEKLYGSDRKTWDEFRKIVEETVADKELAQQVVKDLTRRKNQ